MSNKRGRGRYGSKFESWRVKKESRIRRTDKRSLGGKTEALRVEEPWWGGGALLKLHVQRYNEYLI